jgi:hypothetical protein
MAKITDGANLSGPSQARHSCRRDGNAQTVTTFFEDAKQQRSAAHHFGRRPDLISSG